MIAATMTRCFTAAMSAAVLLFLSTMSPIRATAASTVRTAVEVFVCSTDREDVPALSMYAAGSGNLKMQAPRWSFDGYAWRTSVDVPQGNYIVSARSKRCNGLSGQWYAQPGAVRHVTLTLNEGGRVANIDGSTYAGVVYGSLPSQTAQVELMSADSPIGEQTRRQASIDGASYQEGNLPRGRYVLRMSVGSVIVSREITLPSSNAVLRVDFTPADAAEIIRQQARGSAFVRVSDSTGTPSQTYRLGSAEVDGWVSDPLLAPSDYNTRELRISSQVLGALAATQRFLIKDSVIPDAFKDLTHWSARISNGSNNRILIGLRPNDPAAWAKGSPPLEGHCTTGVGLANILLNFDVASGEIVGTPTICPKV
jgi:hypothetical protein